MLRVGLGEVSQGAPLRWVEVSRVVAGVDVPCHLIEQASKGRVGLRWVGRSGRQWTLRSNCGDAIWRGATYGTRAGESKLGSCLTWLEFEF